MRRACHSESSEFSGQIFFKISNFEKRQITRTNCREGRHSGWTEQRGLDAEGGLSVGDSPAPRRSDGSCGREPTAHARRLGVRRRLSPNNSARGTRGRRSPGLGPQR
ncbi:unnamed protein product [Nesidiocoris tenuis]|uniref:Uncharacterized protein n=1 Tax=Nesidiocoris tenuis TaxID=355587 RepID=A0A6H5GA22_9HEMI|nr:unnamed protein product [Nesidiocoris tenuis]CAA9998615.1 unnamed protein product [Nesidiocoris tenuis]